MRDTAPPGHLADRHRLRSALVEVGDGRLSYRCARGGGERPVVMLHGGASTGGTWSRLAADLLAGGRTVVAPDLRGHGASFRSRDYSLAAFADDVLAFLPALGLGAVDLVGHSLGARVALDVARARTGEVARLVAEEPPSPPIAVRRPAGAAVRMGLAAALRAPLRRDCDYRAVRTVLDELREPSPSWWRELSTVSSATLVLDGGASSHVGSEGLAHLADRLPHGRLATIPAGHRIHSLAYRRYHQVVGPWLGPP